MDVARADTVDAELETMRRHHEAMGEIPPERGLAARLRRFVRRFVGVLR